MTYPTNDQQGYPGQGGGYPAQGAPGYPPPADGAAGYPPPEYGTPPSGAAGYPPSAYGTPQGAAPAYPPPQGAAPAYPPPQYGAPAYQQPGYAPPGYGAPGARPPRANPLAGILLIVGGLAGIAVGAIPWVGVDMPGVIAAINMLTESGPYSQFATGALKALAIALFLAPIGGIVAFVAGCRMFGVRPHGAAAATGIVGALLMIVAALIALVASEGQMLDGAGAMPWILLLCGIPAIIGGIAGKAIK